MFSFMDITHVFIYPKLQSTNLTFKFIFFINLYFVSEH